METLWGLQAAAQQQTTQSEHQDSETAEGQPSDSFTDSVATTSAGLPAAADKLPTAVKETASQAAKAVNKAASKAAKKSEGLKRKLEAPKARSVRKKSWQTYVRQATKSVKQWSEGHKPELGLIAIIVVMIGMVLYMFSRTSSSAKPRDITS